MSTFNNNRPQQVQVTNEMRAKAEAKTRTMLLAFAEEAYGDPSLGIDGEACIHAAHTIRRRQLAA